ncbi:MAG: glycosyltransferase family 4 protein [Chitinophaga sp.]|uniref:glycosyltransferase family 4 protein n=1 Tax=Chitinophaga sp. TaxID=1869181 RepID=UPI001B0ECACD|nr:glycosyltransferase family 4 protein [Chitinophaga sp.]MBO9728341.1 glycosyltransferase family 4 protein [Chitinophaga sp.]
MKMTTHKAVDVTKQGIAIVASCIDDWGGCDELWSKSIPYLQAAGYTITVLKKGINKMHPRMLKLAAIAVALIELNPRPDSQLLLERVIRKSRRVIGGWLMLSEHKTDPLREWLLKCKPVLVIINQSINFDALSYAVACSELALPYVIVSHKAVDFFWPADQDRQYMAAAFRKALHCFFVSKHNLNLTEEQFGFRFNNASVVFNPVKVKTVVPYPGETNIVRLACVGRLFLLDKGQDILLRILSQSKWRNRNITISFIGQGVDENGLKRMAALLNVDKVEFKGQLDDFEAICREHHAFILPSRSEGLPLVVIEAMTAGRIVIASRAGGNAEVIEDGVTGYLGHANENDFEEAMERAWSQRYRWEEMGKVAANYIGTHIPVCPECDFAKKITDICGQQKLFN